ncbi:MAG TPA: family 16 glycoside hydrolase [Cyclobacteriaceae bacterium]|nr:family 16 glycoside hydrolase [Cyclobacteriaceae bacterium]
MKKIYAPSKLTDRATMVLALVCATSLCFAQPSMKTLPLNDLSSFRSQAGNWFIVGDVTMDPTIDVHRQPSPEIESTKKGKKKKTAPVEAPSAVTYKSGTGILLNVNNETKKDNLVTNFEHGDIDLELEVMIPKGSNSGIFLQGRYEVQLFDSWGQKHPAFSDIGGIYRNWEQDPEKIYMGKAPILNVAKAPGLWQKMKISFQAPRFNSAGEKIANAKFISVELNGVKIHDNVEVPKLTGAPIENNEKPFGPLMIQGDHGPVAFRNIRYRLMHNSEVTLTDINFKVFHGNFKSVNDFITGKPVSAGAIPQLTWEVAGTEDAFAVVYNGSINIPQDDEYQFTLRFNGEAKLSVAGEAIVDGNTQKVIQLKKGTYPLEIIYYKDVNWLPPQLGLFVSGSSTYPKALHTFNSYPPGVDLVASIPVKVGSGPKLLRAFLDFEGDRSRRLTHTIAVGEPGGIHYIYDLKAGNVVCVWQGDFVDATPMWHDRGDGSFRPVGMAEYLFTGPPLALLQDQQSAFSPLSDDIDFRSKGYALDEKTGRPVFSYTYKGIGVEDKIYPTDEDKSFTREITFSNVSGTGFYFKLAEGSEVSSLEDGTYIIGDKEYYIKILSSTKPSVRDQPHGKKELLVPVDGNQIRYSIVW